MSLTIQDYGIKSYLTKDSNWLASHSPCNIYFRRKDASVASIIQSGGIKVLVPVDVYNEANVGDLCYVGTEEADGTPGPYNDIFEITHMESPGGGVYYLKFDETTNVKATWAYPSGESNHAIDTWLNLMSRDYTVEFEVLAKDFTAFQIQQFTNAGGDWNVFGGYAAGNQLGVSSLTPYRWKYSPPPSGKLKVNLSELISTFIDLQHLYLSPQEINIPEAFTHSYQPNKRRVFLKYRQNWSELDQGIPEALNTWVIDEGNPLVFLNAVRQNDTEYGPNLAEYVMHDQAGFGRFLQLFDEPNYYLGYPFYLSFITSDDFINSYKYQLIINEYTVNGTLLNTLKGTEFQLNPSELHHLYLPDEYTVVAATCDYITVTIHKWLDAFSTQTRFGTPLKIKVIRNCGTNQKAFIWKNRLGGESIWVFKHNQEMILDNETKADRMIVYEDSLTRNQWECLQDLANGGNVVTSPLLELLNDAGVPVAGREMRTGTYVYMIDPEKEGELRSVVVEKQRLAYKSKQSRTSLSFTLKYKETFIQQ